MKSPKYRIVTLQCKSMQKMLFYIKNTHFKPYNQKRLDSIFDLQLKFQPFYANLCKNH